jgi:hypothetical protein
MTERRIYNDDLKERFAQQAYGCSYSELGYLEKDSVDRTYDEYMESQS